MEDQWKTNIVI